MSEDPCQLFDQMFELIKDSFCSVAILNSEDSVHVNVLLMRCCVFLCYCQHEADTFLEHNTVTVDRTRGYIMQCLAGLARV